MPTIVVLSPPLNGRRRPRTAAHLPRPMPCVLPYPARLYPSFPTTTRTRLATTIPLMSLAALAVPRRRYSDLRFLFHAVDCRLLSPFIRIRIASAYAYAPVMSGAALITIAQFLASRACPVQTFFLCYVVCGRPALWCGDGACSRGPFLDNARRHSFRRLTRTVASTSFLA